MSTPTVVALRVILAVALTGSLVVQGLLVPLLWLDLDGAPAGVRLALVVLVALGVLALQVIGVATWRLLTLARRGTVFSAVAFRWVDTITGALVAGAVVVLGLAVTAAVGNRTTPGDAVAPGLVGLVCGVALVIAGVALLVRVLRALLVQAVALDAETRHLQAELSGVV